MSSDKIIGWNPDNKARISGYFYRLLQGFDINHPEDDVSLVFSRILKSDENKNYKILWKNTKDGSMHFEVTLYRGFVESEKTMYKPENKYQRSYDSMEQELREIVAYGFVNQYIVNQYLPDHSVGFLEKRIESVSKKLMKARGE